MRGETSDVRVCGELPIFDTNQQFATHRLQNCLTSGRRCFQKHEAGERRQLYFRMDAFAQLCQACFRNR